MIPFGSALHCVRVPRPPKVAPHWCLVCQHEVMHLESVIFRVCLRCGNDSQVLGAHSPGNRGARLRHCWSWIRELVA